MAGPWLQNQASDINCEVESQKEKKNRQFTSEAPVPIASLVARNRENPKGSPITAWPFGIPVASNVTPPLVIVPSIVESVFLIQDPVTVLGVLYCGNFV